MTDKIHTYKRTRVAPRRQISRLVRGENAETALEGLDHGVEILGFTKGQFSLIDLVIACLRRTGPAHVTVATWTAAKAEVETAYRLLRESRVLSCQWLVDYSFPVRQPQYCERLRERFGDDCIRLGRTHAKFVLLKNDDWNIAIRTSMNLNTNPRFEQFELSDDPAMCGFLQEVVDDVFSTQEAGKGFEQRHGQIMDQLAMFGVDAERLEDTSAFGLDVANYPV